MFYILLSILFMIMVAFTLSYSVSSKAKDEHGKKHPLDEANQPNPSDSHHPF